MSPDGYGISSPPGFPPKRPRAVWGHGPAGMEIFNHLNSFQEPLRVPDLLGHIRSMGLPTLSPPIPVGSAKPFLAAPVFHRGERFGNFFLANSENAVTSSPRKTRRPC